ncbi:hypothetical protein K2173_022122 [Erythroxylum novogranatense]|uniref:Pentatricopeptide repeat-containing protein n=1 Tax=Erythroxylum novogranatense TaxID=1862640 RepID=A0AAV8TVI1_9ROSI|nr:hypothetical protein K2173_022122 [Erythroxylum novogranatense]
MNITSSYNRREPYLMAVFASFVEGFAMARFARALLIRKTLYSPTIPQIGLWDGAISDTLKFGCVREVYGLASGPSLSIWRRKKEMSKEGLLAAKELRRLQSDPPRLDRFVKSHVSRLLKSDLVAVLFEFQRQDQVFLCMKLYEIIRKEIWYRPDMFFYRDMLMMLARNRKVDETKRVWQDLKREEVLFDQHTFGDIVRAFLDSRLPVEAMEIYKEMRQSPDPPLSLPFRVILKGLLQYPELRMKVKDEFLELFPDMIVYDPAEDLFEDERESE